MAAPKFVYVIVDTPEHERVIQAGHPPTQMSAYRLEVTSTQDDAVANFVASHSLKPGTRFGVVSERSVTSHVLAPRLESADLKPGEAQP